MRASVKLKGIDGGPHKRWIMWFNSINAKNLTRDRLSKNLLEREGCEFLELRFRWCMAVVSSCGDVFGSVHQRAQPLTLVTVLIPFGYGRLSRVTAGVSRRKVRMTSSQHAP